MTADQEVSRVPGTPSLYRKVAEDIKAAIEAGGYAAGTRLPSEHELAERYSVSRGTVRQAFAALRADGIIASRRGARRVVLGGQRVQSFGELLSFSRWARAMGKTSGWKVVSLVRRPGTATEADRLGIPAGDLVYHLTRVRLLSGRPVMIERAAYPDQVGRLLGDMDLVHGSVTERLEEHGIVFADAEHVIDAIPASAEDARLLEVSSRLPLLRERRLTTDPAGVPVEWSDDRYLGSAIAFGVHNCGRVWVSGRRAGAELRLALRARALWEQLAADVPGLGFRPDGSVTVARDDAELHVLKEAAELPDADRRGFELLDPAAVRAVNPALRGGFAGGLLCRGDAITEPRTAQPALRGYLAAARGYQWLPGREAVAVEPNAVRDHTGAWHHADLVVLCTGAALTGLAG